MKRLLGVLVCSFILSHSALAVTNIPWTKEGCESVKGTWITAKSATDDGCDAAHCNGLHFCRSSQKMNWWSAAIWCQSIGRKLASLANVCPGIPTGNNTTAGSCFNAKGVGSGYGWTDTPWDSTRSFFVDLSAGSVGAGNAQSLPYNATRTTTSCYALCQ